LTLVRDHDIQIVLRQKPREILYVRKPPPTILRPTPAQAEVRLRFAQAIRESKKYTVEEVARLVGGEVVEVNGKKAIRMPDGRILMKHIAYASHAMRGFRSQYRRVAVPAWLEELSKKYYTPIPRTTIEKVLKPAK
jgi:hypothetical protein